MNLQSVSLALLVAGTAAWAGHSPAAAQNPAPAAASAPAAPAVQEAASNQIRAGEERTGALATTDPSHSDGTFYHDYIYTGRRGERITITLRSDVFDAYLRFGQMRNGEFTQIAARDDGAGGSDSLLQTTLPADGEYVVRVSTFLDGTGAYRLKVESRR
ncbi:MAG TPA: hypothetical protein VHG28_16120 [Longimicrobiaceae bacterium]|nr:hypothetical protein [Longimicrobiaceae bacterium]